jgi:hypothetical protein
MSNKNADVVAKLSTILLVPNNPLDLIERLSKFIDISNIESKYLLQPNDLIKKKNVKKYLGRNFL